MFDHSRWPVLRLPVALALAAAILGLGVLGAFRLKVETDITALLPERAADRSALYELVRSAGFMRKVAIVVGPTDPGSDDLHSAIDQVAAAVGQTPGILPLAASADMDKVRLAALAVAKGAANLYRTPQPPLDEQALSRRLEDLKQRLAAPEALVTQSFLLADPFGLGRPALASLEGLSASLGAVVERGHVLSADRRYGLVAVTLDFDPLDVDRAGRFIADLERALAQVRPKLASPSIETVALGGVHFASSSAAAVRADITRAFVLTAFAVALVFLVLLRRLRLLPAALLPGGLGIAAGIAAFGLAGVPLHGLTLGFASTLTGISIDYAIHLLYGGLSGDPAAGPRQRMRSALDHVSRPIVLGCLTTVAAFVLVSTSGFPGIRQLALFAAISVSVAMVTTLLVLPPLSPWLLANSGPPRTAAWLSQRLDRLLEALFPLRRRVLLAGLAALFLMGCALLAASGRLSGDPRELGSDDEALDQRQALLSERFMGVSQQLFLVATGEGLEQALAANDALYDALLEGGVTAQRIVSVSPVLPSGARQARSRESTAALLADRSKIEALFTNAGFTPQFAADTISAYAPPPLSWESYKDTALESLVGESVFESADGARVLTRITGGSEAELSNLEAIAARVPGCSLVSERLETRAALHRMVGEMARMLGIWLVVALGGLWLVRRSLRFAVAAVVPALLGVAAGLAALALLGRPVTAVASAGITLVLGLGVDYGVFMLSSAPAQRGHTALAVLASALTTIAGFGVLATAQVKAMADLGIIILVGVSASFLAALLVTPSLSPIAPKEKPIA